METIVLFVLGFLLGVGVDHFFLSSLVKELDAEILSLRNELAQKQLDAEILSLENELAQYGASALGAVESKAEAIVAEVKTEAATLVSDVEKKL